MGRAALCGINKEILQLSATSRIMKIFTESSVFLLVATFAVILLIIGMLLPVKSTTPVPELPWQIEQSPNGLRVFGLTLGHSTVADAQKKFHEQAEISLFVSDTGKFAVEAYFDQVNLGGLRAKVVLTAALSQADLQAMHERGLRTSAIGSGRKVELHHDDRSKVWQSAIASINYLPSSTLDEALIVQRFGEPAQRVREEKSEILHLLYPQKGLDIALNKKNKAVFQYFPPQDFPQLMAPLMSLTTAE